MRTGFLLAAIFVSWIFQATNAVAAEQAKINEAMKKGAEYLKKRNENLKFENKNEQSYALDQWRIGAMSLSGMAMIEAGIPRDDPVLKKMVETVRGEALAQIKTYNISLAILFLDRYGVPSDEPLLQILGVRLYSGLCSDGAWKYDCGTAWTAVEIAQIRTALSTKPVKEQVPEDQSKDGTPPKLHPEARRYLLNVKQIIGLKGRPGPGGDNSNTQFGLIGLWVAARHHVSFDDAFALIDAHFLTTQSREDGGWEYGEAGKGTSCPMTCAGLLGLAVGAARASGATRERKESGSEDPFYNPTNTPVKEGRPGNDPRTLAMSAGLMRVALEMKKFDAKNYSNYTLWSLERVCMAYHLETLGDVKWHDFGSDILLGKQESDGSWLGDREYGPLVSTSFSILFLSRSNYVTDLTEKMKGRVKDPGTAELRGNRGVKPSMDGTKPVPTGDVIPGVGTEITIKPSKETPPKIDGADQVAKELVAAIGNDWPAKIKVVGEGKGSEFTYGLARAIPLLDGERQKQVREALAERLTRMTAKTLQTMLKDSDGEVRRAACLACAMKDDKAHIPDLIDRLTDSSDPVVRAARAGLKSLTGKDFGPAADADDIAKAKAKAEWRAWYESRDKK